MKSILSDGVLISLEVITNHCALVFLVFLFPFFLQRLIFSPSPPTPFVSLKRGLFYSTVIPREKSIHLQILACLIALITLI